MVGLNMDLKEIEKTRLLGLTVEDIQNYKIEDLDMLSERIHSQMQQNWQEIEQKLGEF